MPRQIKITLRAVFQQPTGILNPMGMKMKGNFPVEIFRKADNWQVREISTPKRIVYEKLGRFCSIDLAIGGTGLHFERCVESWQMWGTVPGDGDTALSVERLLLPDEVVNLGGDKWGFRIPEDYTHIIHAPAVPLKAKVPPAACGAQVDAKCFINNRANVEPSCRKCAEVWREFYQEKSA